MKKKEYLDIDKQLELLESKGLNFGNKKFAKQALTQIGYYKLINAYKFPFIEPSDSSGHYIENINFEHLYYLYQFDLQLETIVFKATTSAEIELKARLSNLVSNNYGISPSKYLNASNYLPQNDTKMQFAEFKSEIKKQIRIQSDKHPAILWYKENYNSSYPFWVISNILTIGHISKMFSFLKPEDKSTISREYSLFPQDLASFIVHINHVRNICAHNDVLCRYKSKNSIPQNNIKKIYTFLEIDKNVITGRYTRGTNDFLATLIVLKYMINDSIAYNNLITGVNGALSNLQKKIPQDCYNKIVTELGLLPGWEKLSKTEK